MKMADSVLAPKYMILPKACIDLWVESVGIPKLPDAVGEVLAEDVSYRIRESLHNALRIMKHCKRSCLTTEDFNNALKQSNTEPIYGHGGVEGVSFKSVSFKDGRVCYIEEKDINLRDMALELVYPADPGETSVKASWLVLEGHQCTAGKSKEDHKAPLKEPISSYLTNITSAIIGNISHLRKIALKDLLVNKKLQIVLPHLVSFFSSQIKQHTGKDSFTLIASYILLSINALVENQSVLLDPYVFQLVKIMLFIVIEAQIPVSKWSIKDKAAHVLAHLCRKQNLHNQLLKSYQDSLNDNSRPLSYLYGVVVGVRILGVDAVESILYPILKEKLKIFSEKCETAESDQEIVELAALKSAFSDAAALLFTQNESSHTYHSKKHLKGITYMELYEELGDEFTFSCSRSNHECMLNTVPRLASLTKSSTPLSVNKSNTVSTDLINKQLKKLKDDNKMETNHTDDKIVTKIIIGDTVSDFTSKKKKLVDSALFKTLDTEKEEEEEEEGEIREVEEEVPCKKRKMNCHNNIDVKKVRGTHRSFEKKHTLVKDLRNISNFLPIM